MKLSEFPALIFCSFKLFVVPFPLIGEGFGAKKMALSNYFAVPFPPVGWAKHDGALPPISRTAVHKGFLNVNPRLGFDCRATHAPQLLLAAPASVSYG